jgi:hypothetical protein
VGIRRIAPPFAFIAENHFGTAQPREGFRAGILLLGKPRLVRRFNLARLAVIPLLCGLAD